MEVDPDSHDLTPRPYQEELLRIAVSKNTILYLPTGSGKTFIAVMLIKALGAEISNSEYDQGAKRSIFLVNTVTLVDQQADYLLEYTPFTVGRYSGEIKCDFWKMEDWLKELREYQILVMTAQIFLDMVQHGYFDLARCNLLIFDECHHGVDDHPMRQIMKQVNMADQTKLPRILGLTATLLNRNVKQHSVIKEVNELEATYNSKIATVEALNQVLRYSTNPAESCEYFQMSVQNTVEVRIIRMIEQLQETVAQMSFPSNKQRSENKIRSFTVLIEGPDINRRIHNVLEDIIQHVRICGLFGGSQALVAHIVQFERMRKHSQDELTFRYMQVIITTLTAALKVAMDELGEEGIRLLDFSSHKVLHLMQVLIQYQENCRNKPLSGIVFVEKRFTAKVLFYILKSMRNWNKDFANIHPDFLVGFKNNPFNDTREAIFERKQHMNVLERFRRRECNLLIATNVIEEGLDIPNCTLVVMFDLPQNYRGYIQSKGRARHTTSKYILMVPSNDTKFAAKVDEFRAVEQVLRNMLEDQTRTDPSEEMISEMNFQLIEPYIVESTQAKATTLSAIQLVNRYCSTLPQDKFTALGPNWYKQQKSEGFQVVLELPISSGLKTPIYSPPGISSIKAAKRAAALETIKQLHQIGELTDHLLPLTIEKIIEDCWYLFPYWEKDDVDLLNTLEPARPGTSKRRRRYKKRCPDALTSAYPSESQSMNFLHIIEFIPMYPKPSEANICHNVFYENFKSRQTFGLLTSKRLPRLCDFSLYLSTGEVRIHLIINQPILGLTNASLKELNLFHAEVFGSVLKLLKSFLIFDNLNGENSYLIVPVNFSEPLGYHLDMELVKSKRKMEEIEEPTTLQRRNINVRDNNYLNSVVYPWYRTRDTGYVVCEITGKLNALSPFPHENYSNYVKYFENKWALTIESPNEPLLLVKAMSSRLNFLKPGRSTSFKRKNQDNEDFEEHFIPELCVKISFPAIHWMKAKCIPSVLHRIHYLLLADQLRTKISSEALVGRKEPAQWKPLMAKPYLLNTHVEPDEIITTDADFVDGRQSPVGEDLDMKRLEFQVELSDHINYTWKDEQEPVDIERNIDTITLLDIEYFDHFVSQKLPTATFNNLNLSPSNGPYKYTNKLQAITFEKPEREMKIAILDKNMESQGPELWEVFQALTAITANDVVNYERYEILGDSFLKFGASLFLWLKFPMWNEGTLTNIKGRLVGNRNLFYCGRDKKLGNILKVSDFEPNSDWFPPKFTTPPNDFFGEKISCNVYYNLNIPLNEQMSGILSRGTQRHINEILERSMNDRLQLSDCLEDYLGKQIVNDKVVADAVEALLGCYLCSNGIDGAFTILNWFKIIPDTNLMSAPMPNPLLLPTATTKDIEFHIPSWHTLEKTINYRFNNKAYLLQALTHPSYITNRLTECYQRLEFIGDAILDFLITCHIYEQSGEKLNPGDVTDLRSALVNNVVFASLSVKYGFHKYLLMSNPKLTDVILNFARRQAKRNYVIDDEVLTLLEEADYSLADYVDVPKVLGDLFESMIGAVFLDTKMNLKRTWEVIYGLMNEQIIQFSENIPKNPVRMLYENTRANARFLEDKKMDSGVSMSKLSFYVDGKKKLVYGFGDSKKHSRRAAAKIALQAIHANNKIDDIFS